MIATGASVLGLIVMHLAASRLRFLDVVPRSRWLSIAGGTSVAYVFVHLLPDLAAHQVHFSDISPAPWLDHHIWLIAMAGLVTFYGLERRVKTGRQESEGEGVAPNIFRLHILSFTLYNGIIGLLIARREEMLVWFVLAMALHFLVTDYSLRADHAEQYQRRGRWIVVSGLLIGYLLGILPVEIPEVYLAALAAFLGGGVILNVMKEELPEDRESRFWPFALGAGIYSLVLLAAA